MQEAGRKGMPGGGTAVESILLGNRLRANNTLAEGVYCEAQVVSANTACRMK